MDKENTTETFAIKKEIESQILNLDIKIIKEVLISDLVELLSKKRQLQELYKQYSNV